jgi:hypothetical protein
VIVASGDNVTCTSLMEYDAIRDSHISQTLLGKKIMSENFGGAYWLFVTVTIIASPFIIINWLYLLGFRFKWMHRLLFAFKFMHRFKSAIQVRDTLSQHRSVSQLSFSPDTGESYSDAVPENIQLPAPIGVRGFWSLVIWNAGIMTAWCASQWTILFDVPCFIPIVLAVFGNMLQAASFMERTLRLYFQLCICNQACEFAEENFGNDSDEQRKSKNSRFFQWLLLNRASILKDSPFAIPKLIVFAFALVTTSGIMANFFSRIKDLSMAPMSNLYCQEITIQEYRIVIGVLLVNGVLRITFSRLMKQMEDSLGIKRELRMLGLNSLVFGSICGVYVFWPDASASVRLPTYWYLMYFVSNTIGIGSAHLICIFTLFSRTRSFNNKLVLKHIFSAEVTTSSHSPIQDEAVMADPQEEKKGHHAKQKSTGGIEMILNNPESCKLFEEFLRKEFSVENLLCYKAVQSLEMGLAQNKISLEEGRKMCKKIVQEFSGPSCRLPVNISYETSSKLSKIAAQEESGIQMEDAMKTLRQMQKEVLVLMTNDSFRRFKSEEEFKAVHKLVTAAQQV